MVDPSSVEMSDFSHLGPGFEAFYEDDQTDESIPRIQRVTRSNNTLPLWGDKGTMNINSLVLQNIVSSPYFKQQLAEISIFHPLLDEIYYNVLHLEPWERGTRKLTGMTGMCGQVRGVGAGGIVSSAFCLLFKLFAVKLTRKNLVQMINYEGSNYIRGLGFLYIRYCQPPEDLWDWYEPFLDDKEDIDPRAGGGDPMTVGQMCKTLLTKLDWYSTLFPRIPVPIQKQIESKFIELRRKKERQAREQPTTSEQTWDTAEELFAEAAQTARDKERSDSKSRDSPASKDRDRDVDRNRRRSRDRDMDKRSDLTRDRKVGLDDDKPYQRSRGSKCRHHKRHHHCLKHKLKCPRKATNNRPVKKEDKNGTEKEESRKLESKDRDRREKSKSRDRREKSKSRDRVDRDRERDGNKDRDRDSNGRDRDNGRDKDRDRNRDRSRDRKDRDRSSRRRSRSPSTKRSRQDKR